MTKPWMMTSIRQMLCPPSLNWYVLQIPAWMRESSTAFVRAVKDRLVKLCDVLGLIVEKDEEILDEDIEKLIEERQAARKARDFKRADEIRDELQAKGILLEDTREGVKWKRA